MKMEKKRIRGREMYNWLNGLHIIDIIEISGQVGGTRGTNRRKIKKRDIYPRNEE